MKAELTEAVFTGRPLSVRHQSLEVAVVFLDCFTKKVTSYIYLSFLPEQVHMVTISRFAL